MAGVDKPDNACVGVREGGSRGEAIVPQHFNDTTTRPLYRNSLKHHMSTLQKILYEDVVKRLRVHKARLFMPRDHNGSKSL